MPSSDSGGAGWRHAATELADELRGIIEALAVSDLSEYDLEEARERARELLQCVQGPRRERWYDAVERFADLSPASREACLDQSPIRGKLNAGGPAPLDRDHDGRGRPSRRCGNRAARPRLRGPPARRARRLDGGALRRGAGRGQVESYAERRGMTLAEAERWLGPNLGYEPTKG
jgi:hypothetical protein